MKEKDFLDPARLRILYEQYVSPDMAEMLVGESEHVPMNGTIQDLTVLFADISNFTQLIQRVDLIVLAEFLKEYFALFTTTIYHNRGALDKFMGDGALAIFGAPVAVDNQADRALNCGRILLEKFPLLRREYRHKSAGFEDISLGVGISCSEMFIGNLGSNRRFDYTVIGLGVNAAQRLATYCTGDAVLFTDDVLKRVSADIEITKTEELLLKGFNDQVVVHHAF